MLTLVKLEITTHQNQETSESESEPGDGSWGSKHSGLKKGKQRGITARVTLQVSSSEE